MPRGLPVLLALIVGCAPVYRGADGASYAFPASRATLVFFVAVDCPISNSYAPEMNRIAAEYGPRGVEVVGVYADPETAPEAARRHSSEFGYSFRTILDPDLGLVRRTGAAVVPEAAVLDPTGAVAYVGRIDDLYIDFRNRRAAPLRRELREALDAVLGGRPVPCSRVPAVGCFIDQNGGKP